MYSEAFCKIYNEFGWNYYPEAFGEQLLQWAEEKGVTFRTAMDLGCGTGVLCEYLLDHGITPAGMDFSAEMIDIARSRNSEIPYQVGDMIVFCPEETYDLVTCTGDALNHITKLTDVDRIFGNVYRYLNEGGYFIFDLLHPDEVDTEEGIDLDWSDTVKSTFTITQDEQGVINLNTTVYENGQYKFEENITEIIHDVRKVCDLLAKNGFTLERCAHSLSDSQPGRGLTWFIIARK